MMVFDRLNAEIDQIGDRVRTVFESSKLDRRVERPARCAGSGT